MYQRVPASDSKGGGVSSSDRDFLQEFISEAEYAARRGVSVRTCQRDRQLGQAPPFVIVGRRVYYRIEAVKEWLRARERRGVASVNRRR